jgi:hypothetical protein
MVLCGNRALKQKTVWSGTVYCVHVLLHTTEKHMLTCQHFAASVIKQR